MVLNPLPAPAINPSRCLCQYLGQGLAIRWIFGVLGSLSQWVRNPLLFNLTHPNKSPLGHEDTRADCFFMGMVFLPS